jgi:hypothetical protein
MRGKASSQSDEHDRAEIRRYAEWALQKAGVGDQLPTPVRDIVASAELAVEQNISLSDIHADFFSRAYGILGKALSKLRALIDLRENLIYLDLKMTPARINFATLHDSGHSILPWQRNAYRYEDDDQSLSPDVKDQFEFEANQFAAHVMFQVDRFTRDAADCPLAIRTPMALSKRYGASCHAAIRRYVENHHEPCGVLVCRSSALDLTGQRQLKIEQGIFSRAFLERFGRLRMARVLDADHPFSRLISSEWVRLLENGTIELEDGNGSPFKAAFHVFNNSYNIFILLFPQKPPTSGWQRILLSRN